MNSLENSPKRHPKNSSEVETGGQAHLRFQLTETLTCAFSMDEIHEVAVISPAQLTPIFNQPAWVLGLLTRRSRILWVVDLAALLFDADAVAQANGDWVGQSGLGRAGQYSIVVARVHGPGPTSAFDSSSTANQRLLGFLVHAIRGYSQLAPDSIQSPAAQRTEKSIVSGLLPYMRGSVLDDDHALHVLDVAAIASRLKRKTIERSPP